MQVYLIMEEARDELSDLQPITSLNIARLPVNDTAIKTEQFGA